jgi:hypothetical protein
MSPHVKLDLRKLARGASHALGRNVDAVQFEVIALQPRRESPGAATQVDRLERGRPRTNQGLQMGVKGTQDAFVAAIGKNVVITILREAIEKRDFGSFLL